MYLLSHTEFEVSLLGLRFWGFIGLGLGWLEVSTIYDAYDAIFSYIVKFGAFVRSPNHKCTDINCLYK